MHGQQNFKISDLSAKSANFAKGICKEDDKTKQNPTKLDKNKQHIEQPKTCPWSFQVRVWRCDPEQATTAPNNAAATL